MELKYPNLFKPAIVNGKYFKNRLLGAPLGIWTFSPENYIFDYSVEMFGEKAGGGVASVILGHTEVMTGTDEMEEFGLYFNLHKRPQGDAALAEFASAVKQHGAHVGVQINHSGMNIHGVPGRTYYGPSAVQRDDGVIVKEMSRDKIKQTIGMFVDCALRLKNAGFDMVMLHGGHGWLLNQFFSPAFNRRTDEYGGSLDNRCRFGVELVSALREAVGKDFIIEYRISGIDPNEDPEGFEELVTYLGRLEGMIDIVNVSSGIAHNSGEAATHTFPSYLNKRGTNLHLAAPLKKRIITAVAVVGNISDPEMAEQVIKDGTADFVSVARALIADPEFPKKARAGRPEDIRPCIGCYNCLETMHGNHFFGCDVNPRAGREHRIKKPVRAERPKKVVVVGGGPAGMQAALTASECGHRVTLFEKSGALGGLLKLTDGDSVKYLLNRLKNYFVAQIEKSGVDVRLNTEATAELVAAENPDVIINACGSMPIVPAISGVDGDNVFTCITAHESWEKLGQSVVIIGGNMVGCETAISLYKAGKKVTIVEMTDKLYSDANNILKPAFELNMRGITKLVGAKCTQILPDGIMVVKDGEEQKVEARSVILAVGMRSQRQLCDSLYSLAPEYFEVGDCIKPANVCQATRTACYAALDI
ncbi:MAG: FAD-dependent oxidoreductase [Oscillospiraceae bacterium]|jgi:2,4-dienoyl-CoA reductase-like NADH-dependent reductase (Old Yellow Enzyme family)/thioredoxin reductase